MGGEGAYIREGLLYGQMYRFVVVLQVNGPVTGETYT